MISVIFSAVALLISVLSPFISSWSEHRHELKMYTLRFSVEHKATIIEQYLNCASEVIQYATPETRSAFGAAHGKMLLYADESVKRDMMDIYNMFIDSGRFIDFKGASDKLAVVSEELSKQYSALTAKRQNTR